MVRRPTDPDDTEGRALYRARADALAHRQMSMAKRRVKYARLPAMRPADAIDNVVAERGADLPGLLAPREQGQKAETQKE
jgi:hypothetical protein